MSEKKNQIQKPNNPVASIKRYLGTDSVKRRFEEMLGERASAFMNTIINVVRSSKQLQECYPESTISASLIAASLNLPIEPALGQAAIVPYGKKAQFQIMYKGVTQLCIRSGQYATIHCTEVYRDELRSWNPITGEIKFTDQSTWKMRYTEKAKDVVGHYAYFKLLAGFEKRDYMTTDEALAHAKKYSKAYQYDLRDKKQTSKWSTDPIPMGNKTVLLRLLTKYGVMSIEMQKAFIADYESFEQSQAEAEKKINAEAGSEIIDADFEQTSDPADPDFEAKKQQQIQDMKTADEKGKKSGRGRGRPKKNPPAETPQNNNPGSASTEQQQTEMKFKCKAGHVFDEPHQGSNNIALCPKCLTKDFKAIDTEETAKPEFMND